jgi:hypothetical protein
MAARVATHIKAGDDVQVKTIAGGLGEFSVFIDGRKVIDTSRFWYPRPSKIVTNVRDLLAKK